MAFRFSTRIAASVTLVVAGTMLVAPLTASTFLTAQFREVVADAALIVRGRVTDVRAFRSPAGEVQSAVTLSVEAALKGDADRFVSMRLPGGTIGRYRTVMTGAPTMKVGDRAVVFLKRGPSGAWWPVGLAQGIYRINARDATVAAPVVPGTTTDSTGRVVRGDSRRKPLPLRDFESLVRLVMAAARPEGRR